MNSIFTRSNFLLLLVALAWVSCQPKATAPPVYAQILRINISSEPPSLDPTQAGDLTSGIVLKMLFDGLTRIGRDDKVEMAMAEKVDISPDGRVYRFTLREAYWSNGQPVKALDFAYAWRMSLSPEYPASAAYQLYAIKNAREAKEGRLPAREIGISVVDEKTLEVELEAPIPYFLEMTASHSFYPINYRAAKHDSNWASEAGPNFLSNGPFRLKSWKHNNELVVERNPDYWDADSVRLQEIHVSMIEDGTTELNLFESGDLDWAGHPLSSGLPADSLHSLSEEGLLQTRPMIATYYYQFNVEVPPLNNSKVRRALALAINRRAIVQHVTQGGEVAALGLVPKAISLQPEGYFLDHDIEGARTLFEEGLREEGLDLDTFPSLTLSYNTSDTHHKIAQVIQQQWREAFDIQIQLENDEWKVYLDRLNRHSFDIGRLSWIADFRDGMNFLEIFKYKALSSNHTQWSDEKYHSLLDQALNSNNEEKRQNLMRAAEHRLMEEMPIAPVYFLTSSYLKDPDLKGTFLSGLGDVDFRWAYFERESE